MHLDGGGKSQHWPEPLKPREPMASSRCPHLCRLAWFSSFSKSTVYVFSNPKRILKPLLICLPFCFVCSAQVKGNLTFGILTANNPHQGQACCCSVSMWLTRKVGDIPVVCRGVPEGTLRGGPDSYPKGRAAPNSLDFAAPRPGEMQCWDE